MDLRTPGVGTGGAAGAGSSTAVSILAGGSAGGGCGMRVGMSRNSSGSVKSSSLPSKLALASSILSLVVSRSSLSTLESSSLGILGISGGTSSSPSSSFWAMRGSGCTSTPVSSTSPMGCPFLSLKVSWDGCPLPRRFTLVMTVSGMGSLSHERLIIFFPVWRLINL